MRGVGRFSRCRVPPTATRTVGVSHHWSKLNERNLTLRSKTLICYHYHPYLEGLRNVRRCKEYVLQVVFRPRMFHLRAFCSSFVVISLSDEELTALKFLGPGEYPHPFASVSLTYRYAPGRCSGGRRFHHVHHETSSVPRM